MHVLRGHALDQMADGYRKPDNFGIAVVVLNLLVHADEGVEVLLHEPEKR